ncbi:unnamed protein product [Rotaria sp. Silwood1]|nr:unnamed protein product [Rotaria sp. Silwood1]CAF4693578.1 unnamed protein product [Rotaria sp. Silwood1]
MSTHMHCRPFCGTYTSNSSSSSLFARLDSSTTSNNQTYTSSTYHKYDQTLHTSAIVRRRRRLEDPITTYASNYYATFPRQMSKSSSRQLTLLSSQPSSLSLSRQKYKQSNHKNIYCDLFNLLERPSPPTSSLIKQRKKYKSNDYSPSRHHYPKNMENCHTKVKCTNDKKHHNHTYTYYKEKKCQDDKLSNIEQYEQSPEKTKNINNIYQRRSSNRGFFRRLLCNYFCLTSTVATNEYLS